MSDRKPDGQGGEEFLLLGVILFFGFAVLCKLAKWFDAWLPHHRVLFAIAAVILLFVLTYLLLTKINVLRAKTLKKRQILGPMDGAVYCGKTFEKEDVFVKTHQRGMHTQVVGTTNAGKTESVILPWAIQDIRQGRGLILIDGKADRGLLDKLWAYTVQAKRQNDFRLFSLSNIGESQSFNPLIGGPPEEITERIFNAFEFENSYYRNIQYEVLAQVLRIFAAANEVPTFLKLHQVIWDVSLLSELAEKSKDLALTNWVLHFRNLSGAERDQRTAGLLTQLSQFAFGAAARVFNQEKAAINIDEALRENQILYFQLPALLSPFLGKATGKLVLQSLQAAVANRHRAEQKDAKFFSVFLDDFSEYLYPGFVTVLNKSRSANVGIVFAHQALGDLQGLGESVANSILTNSNIKVFMRGNDPDSAEYFSKVIGTLTTVKFTERQKRGLLKTNKSGDLSARDAEEFVIHPNFFKRELGVGQAVMVIPHEAGAKTVRVRFERFPDLDRQPIPTVEHASPILLVPRIPEKRSEPNPTEQSVMSVLIQKDQKESA